MIKNTTTSNTSTSRKIERKFVTYFSQQGYQEVPGSSLLDPSVPMSFVMSAGLVQVETSAKRYDKCSRDRYILLQNCFRYFDLENVGYDKAHLSLFRMPGAFIFGSVSKKRVISTLWKLLIDVYDFSPDSLWVSYFAGGDVNGHYFEADETSRQAWLDVGVSPHHVIGLGPDHNFWKQGASVVGNRDAPKCGANTEVFFDRGSILACGHNCRPGCRCGRFVELSNTLFITQHMNEDLGIVRPLEDPFTELVLGSERVAMILQGKQSIFKIDRISPLMKHISDFIDLYDSHLSFDNASEHMRIIADHIRALLFLTADGAPPPGKGGRARLMRKLVRGLITAQKVLEISDDAFIPSLLEAVPGLFEEEKHHLASARSKCLGYILEERDRFESTLRRGEKRLDRLLSERENRALSGKEALALEKRHGLPIPLLKLMLANKQATYDHQAYEHAYARWYQSVS
jgi:alanyl-tRNA synthetase